MALASDKRSVAGASELMLLHERALPIVFNFTMNLLGESTVGFRTTVPELWRFKHRPGRHLLETVANCKREQAENYCFVRNTFYLAKQLWYVAKRLEHWLRHFEKSCMLCQHHASSLQAMQPNGFDFRQYKLIADDLRDVAIRLQSWQEVIISQQLSECNRLATALQATKQRAVFQT